MQHFEILFLATSSWPSDSVSLMPSLVVSVCMHAGHLSASASICGFHPVGGSLRIQDGVWHGFSSLQCALETRPPLPTGSSVEVTEVTACPPCTSGGLSGRLVGAVWESLLPL